MTKNERIIEQCARIFRVTDALIGILSILQQSLLIAACIGFFGLATDNFSFVHSLGGVGLLFIAFSAALFIIVCLLAILVLFNIARAEGDDETKYDELIALARKKNKENGK